MYSMTAPGLLTSHVAPPNRCSNRLFTAHPEGVETQQGRAAGGWEGLTESTQQDPLCDAHLCSSPCLRRRPIAGRHGVQTEVPGTAIVWNLCPKQYRTRGRAVIREMIVSIKALPPLRYCLNIFPLYVRHILLVETF